MSDFEGLPVALLEAMAAGVVPLARSIPSGIPELIQHERTGLLVVKNPAKAAETLVELSRNKELWQHCSANARALVESAYSSDRCFDLWLALLKQHHCSVKPQYPLSISTLADTLPLNNRRFQTQYPSIPSLWSRLHPRRVLQKLKRLAQAQHNRAGYNNSNPSPLSSRR